MKRIQSLVLILLLFGISWLSLNTGFTKLDNIFGLLLGQGNQSDVYIAQEIRAPRVLAAILVGATLGIAGSLSQGVLRNPLAEPALLGTTGGAALASLLGVLFFNVTLGSLSAIALSILGALLATFFTFQVGKFAKNGLAFVVMGIAVSATLTAFVGITAVLINKPEARGVTFWALGTLSMTVKSQLQLIAPILLISWFLAVRIASNLDYLALGDTRARHLGKNVNRIRFYVFIIIAISVGCITSVFGQISFLALATPHIVRSIFGPKHKSLVVNSGILGAIILILADLLARSFSNQNELPLGLMTSLIGAPVLIVATRKWLRANA
jgi:iron complex transport system permease protein